MHLQIGSPKLGRKSGVWGLYFSCLFSVSMEIPQALRILQTGSSFHCCSSLYSLASQYVILRTLNQKEFGLIPEPNTDGKRFCTKLLLQQQLY